MPTNKHYFIAVTRTKRCASCAELALCSMSYLSLSQTGNFTYINYFIEVLGAILQSMST